MRNDTGAEKTLQEKSYMDIITAIDAGTIYGILAGVLIGGFIASTTPKQNWKGYAKNILFYAALSLVVYKGATCVMKRIG